MLWQVAGKTPLSPANTPAAAQSFLNLQTCYTAKIQRRIKNLRDMSWAQTSSPRADYPANQCDTASALCCCCLPCKNTLLKKKKNIMRGENLPRLSIMALNLILSRPFFLFAVFFTGFSLSLSLPNRWVWPEGRGLPFIQICACSCRLNPSRLD